MLLADVAALLEQADVFSFQFDESQDQSKESMMCVIVNTVVGGRKRSLYLGAMRLWKKTGMHLFQATRMLIAAISPKMDMRKLVGIGADGTSANTGRHAGAITLWQKLVPWVQFSHCAAHRLSLAVEHAASKKGIKDIIEFLRTFEELFLTFSFEGAQRVL